MKNNTFTNIREGLNTSGFIDVKKAYQEGVYSDTPANRKIGRVGMTYQDYATKVKQEKKDEAHLESEKSNNSGDSKLPFERKSEYFRKKEFSNLKEGDTIYLEKNHKVGSGNYKITNIGKLNGNPKAPDVIQVEDFNGNKTTFTKDYIYGQEAFKDFKVMDLNYSLQGGSKENNSDNSDILNPTLSNRKISNVRDFSDAIKTNIKSDLADFISYRKVDDDYKLTIRLNTTDEKKAEKVANYIKDFSVQNDFFIDNTRKNKIGDKIELTFTF